MGQGYVQCLVLCIDAMLILSLHHYLSATTKQSENSTSVVADLSKAKDACWTDRVPQVNVLPEPSYFDSWVIPGSRIP